MREVEIRRRRRKTVDHHLIRISDNSFDDIIIDKQVIRCWRGIRCDDNRDLLRIVQEQVNRHGLIIRRVEVWDKLLNLRIRLWVDKRGGLELREERGNKRIKRGIIESRAIIQRHFRPRRSRDRRAITLILISDAHNACRTRRACVDVVLIKEFIRKCFVVEVLRCESVLYNVGEFSELV